jgi:hypothetical protein
LSYGDEKAAGRRRAGSAIGLTGSEPVAPGPEEGAFLLLVKPAEEFLESRIGLDFPDRVERVQQFVVEVVTILVENSQSGSY